jgi:hypothetical protein
MKALDQAAALLEQRRKSRSGSPELAILALHQEALESLSSGAPKAPKTAKAKKPAKKKSNATPAADPQPGN